MQDRAVSALAAGRASYHRRAWREALDAFSSAGRAGTLAAADLELMAMSAYLLGRDDEAVRALERAHQQHLDAGDPVAAARCAIWIGLGLANAGAHARANGWFGRAARLLDRAGVDCVERGYLLIPSVLADLDVDPGLAGATAAQIAGIGERFDEVDLVAFARHAQGRASIKQSRVDEGARLLDEAMVAVLAGELASPLLTGLVYCSVIEACQEVYDVLRAREWTDALSRWCADQPQLVNFTGLCLVHRAEALQFRGEWQAAFAEAQRACRRSAPHEPVAGAGHYRQAEIHRFRGELAEAEAGYRQATAHGWQPQPGLALLRLAQGRVDAAWAGIGRSLAESTEPIARARLLPSYVEIALASRDLVAGRRGAEELAGTASACGTDALAAMAAHARGAVELAEGRPAAALGSLREAARTWRELGAPHELAQVRTLIGLACRQLGDHESAAWELTAARDGFGRLGASHDHARLTALIGGTAPRPGGLTARELQVLRLVASGHSNRSVAAELVLSVRTVDRHVSSILAKLGVPSRTAAAAYAHTHGLLAG